MYWLTGLLIAVGALAVLYFLVSARTDTFTGRWVAWKSSGVEDYLLFPYHDIRRGQPAFYFERTAGSFPVETVTYQYRGKPQTERLDVLLEKTGTTAFLVIKDDVILYENYFNGYQRESIVTSFSIAKSLTSLMVGAAIDDGFIESLDDSLTRYLPELAQVDPGYQEVTLGHLLAMKSGIAFKDTDIPWHDKSRAYYHPYLRTVVTRLPLAGKPGESFVYNTFNPILLGMVLEKATGLPVARYVEARLWQRLGAEFDASWSIDSEADAMAKMESGFNARAVDYARIGWLVLHRGNWQGEQLLSSGWVDLSMKIDPANQVAKFGENVYYQNGWWVIGPNQQDRYTVYAWGHLGQYLFLYPDENMLVLRFGKEIGRVDSWRRIAQEIVQQVSISLPR